LPDKSFKYLADTFDPPSVIPAVLKVTDIAGLIKGASEGAGLGNAFLSHIAAVDGIYHLVRAFDSDEVIHVDDSVDPIRDMETIQGELCAKDSKTLEGVISAEKERVRKEKGMSKAAPNVPISDTFVEAYDKCIKLIEANTPVRTGEFSSAEVEFIKDWGLITTKPQIYVVNLSQKNFIRKGSKWLPKINQWVQSHGGGVIIPVSCDFEENLAALKDDADAKQGKGVKDDDRDWRIYIWVCWVLFGSHKILSRAFSIRFLSLVSQPFCSNVRRRPLLPDSRVLKPKLDL
jgi:ribosome-binding ATPase YchF (GTP1/OBG family)